MSTSRLRGVQRPAAQRRRIEFGGVRRGRGATALGAVALGAMALGLGGAACAKARAETVPDGPPLLVPAPPARVLAPVEALVIPEAAPEPASVPAAAVPPAAPARPVTESRSRPAPPVAAPEAPGSVGGTGDLRAGSASTTTESSVRGMLARAARDRARVNVSQLSAAGRSQYQQSERFTAQAQQALRDRNLIFAATLAEKAAALALELVGR